MQHKLKYIELFESYTNDGVKIPYSRVDSKGKLNINFPKSVKFINPKFNLLTTEVTGDLSIYRNAVLQSVTGFESLQSVGETLSINGNTVLETLTGFNQLQEIGNHLWIGGNNRLTQVTGFNQLQSVGNVLSIRDNAVLQSVPDFESLQSVGGSLSIEDNTVLQSVTGFNQLQEIGDDLCIWDNPNLVSLSIPSTMIRSVNYEKKYIDYEYKHEFKSPEEFVNHPDVIQDCIDKFNPELHSDVVVKQIVENVELWGTPETQGVIINHLLSKRNYWSLIPTSIQHLAEEHYKHLYHSDFKNTGAKSVAKVATGVTYGLF